MSTCILCALDLNQPDQSRKLLETAHKLAKLDGAQLDVLSVVPNFGVGEVADFFPEDYLEKAMDQARSDLEKFVTEVIGAEANKSIRHEVASGKVYQEVLRVAEAAGSDLIVIGSHKPAIRDYLLGSNASHVVRHAPVSVLVIR
ncbi:universal stress protein [Thalassovita sp.]|uniref:universal stress protein n=1 Tax=Thalassovita sp. TaxID=1979401 RepID=UPI0029DE7C63|nr:universal stress protein [Thalassovita sp.]